MHKWEPDVEWTMSWSPVFLSRNPQNTKVGKNILEFERPGFKSQAQHHSLAVGSWTNDFAYLSNRSLNKTFLWGVVRKIK
jgi:hypothetical protein